MYLCIYLSIYLSVVVVPMQPLPLVQDYDRSLLTEDLDRAQPLLSHPTSHTGAPIPWKDIRREEPETWRLTWLIGELVSLLYIIIYGYIWIYIYMYIYIYIRIYNDILYTWYILIYGLWMIYYKYGRLIQRFTIQLVQLPTRNFISPMAHLSGSS